MTERERLQCVLDGKIPDKVPHFELDFQLFEEVFGMTMPNTYKCSQEDSMRYREQCFACWEQVLERYHWAALPINCDYMISDAKKQFGDRALIMGFNGDGVFWMPPGNKIMEFVIDLYEHPEELHVQAKKKCRDAIELAKMQADMGVDVICINSDFGFNEGPFISPEMFAEFVTPYLTQIVGAIHDLGLKAILHSDGDLRKILDQLVSTGIDGYQSIDPQGHMDIAKVKEQYGQKLILMGNVKSAALQDSDPETIRQSVRYAMEYGMPGGRYIFSTSNCIFAGMPPENYEIMLDEYQKHAYYSQPVQE